jgi:hypothetical protein
MGLHVRVGYVFTTLVFEAPFPNDEKIALCDGLLLRDCLIIKTY